LKAHRQRQLRQRMKAGKDWRDGGFVFAVARRGAGRQLGTPLHPRNVLRTLHELLRAADLPRVRFHDLRHSAASLLLASGVQLAEVSKLLGHSELRLTSDVYGHLQRETAARAAERMDAVLS
jgi:integrase